MSIAKMRREYTRGGLIESEAYRDPVRQFRRWFAQAVAAGAAEPNAMTLATATRRGTPSARVVLVKGVSARGFCFYTNYRSGKAVELAGNPRASAVFFWPEMERQVRISGKVSRLSRHASAVYFHSRPRGSQLGAWASDQSRVIPSRDMLEARLRDLEKKYRGRKIPLPPFWGGYRLAPTQVEFWQGRPNRLHDRLLYRRVAGSRWRIVRLAP